MIKCSQKLDNYLRIFSRGSRPLAAEAHAQRLDVIDLGMGNPDLPTPPHVVDRLIDSVKPPATHRYPKPRECSATGKR